MADISFQRPERQSSAAPVNSKKCVPVRLIRKPVLLSLSLLLSGCLTFHDSTLSKIDIEKDCDFAQGALFDNVPYYLSEDKEHAPIAGVSRLFGNYNKAIVQVKISSEGNHLLATFYDKEGQAIATKDTPEKKEYSSAGGRLIINEWSSCKPGEAAAGCVWSHIELSCTKNRNLAVQEVTRGAGLIALLVPIATHSTYLALYKRVTDTRSGSLPPSVAPGFMPQAMRP